MHSAGLFTTPDIAYFTLLQRAVLDCTLVGMRRTELVDVASSSESISLWGL